MPRTRNSHAPRTLFLCEMFCSYLNVFIYNKRSVLFQLKWFKWVYHTVWEMANVLDIQRKGNVVPEEQNYLSADREMIVFNSSGLWWKFPKSKDALIKGKWILIVIFDLSKYFSMSEMLSLNKEFCGLII